MKIFRLISLVLVSVVASLHIGFLVLEMFLWEQPTGLKVFSMTPEQASASAVLAKNQGLYNGFLAAGLFWGVLRDRIDIKAFFLVCVIVAGVYGAVTVGIKILFIQALPAFLALVFTYWARGTR